MRSLLWGPGTVHLRPCSLHCSLFGVVPIFQVSEQQLKDAVAQAVETLKFGKERHQWSLEGKRPITVDTFAN